MYCVVEDVAIVMPLRTYPFSGVASTVTSDPGFADSAEVIKPFGSAAQVIFFSVPGSTSSALSSTPFFDVLVSL